ncbi:MAG: hypothetical protein KME64_39250 [Scytonematopsis contorta HA4267-MV1]|jgi:hypothetical protein|nr:hypothetical protein [Scytonematopsis contorta HA4267-MV1]
MITKILSAWILFIAGSAIHASFNPSSIIVLREEKQTNYSPRNGTNPSGSYRSGIWIHTTTRSTYQGFQGGGPGSGK